MTTFETLRSNALSIGCLCGSLIAMAITMSARDTRDAAEARMAHVEAERTALAAKISEVEWRQAWIQGQLSCERAKRGQEESKLFVFDRDDNKLEGLKDFR